MTQMKRMQTGFLDFGRLSCMICNQTGDNQNPGVGRTGALIALPVGNGCNTPQHGVHIHCLCEVWLLQNGPNIGAMFLSLNTEMELIQATIVLEPRILIVGCRFCGNMINLGMLENFQIGLQLINLMFGRLAMGRYRQLQPPGAPVPPFLLLPIQQLWNDLYPDRPLPQDLR
jgi:hypothetical protein